jgi:hypothetical protein
MWGWCFFGGTGARVIASSRGCEIDFRLLTVFDTGINAAGGEVMRENVQWGLAFAANSLIYAGDLYDAVMTTIELIMGVLL